MRYTAATGSSGRASTVPLGAAADRAGEEAVEPAGLVPTRQHEALELGQRGVRLVALRFEAVDGFLRDPQPPVVFFVWDRHVGAEIEELVLDAVEPGGAPAEHGVELVDVAERGDARVELRDARPVAEARLPRVAAARVDGRQADRFIGVARHEANLVADVARSAIPSIERAMTRRWISLVPS